MGSLWLPYTHTIFDDIVKGGSEYKQLRAGHSDMYLT